MAQITKITPEDIATELGVPNPASNSATENQWQLWIGDADMLVQLRAEQLSVDAESIDRVKINYVVRQAVARHVRRPDDATQVTTAIDDGSESKTYRTGAGRVKISDEEWLILGLTDPKGAYAFDTAPSGTIHAAWCALVFGANYCSCGADIAGYPIFEEPE